MAATVACRAKKKVHHSTVAKRAAHRRALVAAKKRRKASVGRAKRRAKVKLGAGAAQMTHAAKVHHKHSKTASTCGGGHVGKPGHHH